MTASITNFKVSSPPRVQPITGKTAVDDLWWKWFQLLQSQVSALTAGYGLNGNVVNINGNYTVGDSDDTIVADASTGNIVVTLPAAPTAGRMMYFKKDDYSANTVTINANGLDIEGAPTFVLSFIEQGILIQYNQGDSSGQNWEALAEYKPITIAANANPALINDVRLFDGKNISLVQSGQNITTNHTAAETYAMGYKIYGTFNGTL